MSVQPKSKSFFSTTAGVITGAAGVLTAVVGILGAATQLGWIGSKNDAPANPTTTAVSTPATANPGVGGVLPTLTTSPSGRSSPSPTSANARFEVTPQQLDFSGNGEKVVTVKNNGTNIITFGAPEVSGVDADNFTATPADATCTPLDAGRSCQIKVAFRSSRPGQYTAVLAIKPSSGLAQEVSLKASALL